MTFWVAGATLVGTIGSGAISANAASNAADAQQAGVNSANALASAQNAQARLDYAPWLRVGTGAINQLGAAAGIVPNQAPLSYEEWAAKNVAIDPAFEADKAAARGSSARWAAQEQARRDATNRASYQSYVNNFQPDTAALQAATSPEARLASFTASPGYQFRLQQGQQAQNNAFAARGGALSGNALKALADYNQNSASAEYGNWWNQMSGLAGSGQAATNSATSNSAQTSQNLQSNAIGAANARASGIQQQGDIWSGALNSLAGNYAAYKLLGGKAPTTNQTGTASYSQNYLNPNYLNVGYGYQPTRYY